MIQQIAGLPAHPLFVHGAVVLIPLTALLLILWALVPRWRLTLRWPIAIGALVSAGVLVLTRSSGEALAVGKDLGMHETYANAFTAATGLMIGAVVVMAWLASRPARWSGGLGWAVRIAAVVVAVAVLVTSALTGHSGASLVWQGETVGAEQSVSGTTGDGDADAN